MRHVNTSVAKKVLFINCNRTILRHQTVFPALHGMSLYLITCTKCRKQYVDYSTQELYNRVNHHHNTVFTKAKRYMAIHYNFPDHSITNLEVQCIDAANSFEELTSLEHYWIRTLKTQVPYGLNILSCQTSALSN